MNKLEQLKQLREKARLIALEQDKLVEEARVITGDPDESGFTFDYVLNNFGTAEELLKRFENE
jgi:hypothetical protein